MADEPNYLAHQEDTTISQTLGYVYFILAGEFNRIKIGITIRSIEERMKELQTGSCTPLTLLGYSMFQNVPFIESNLHYLFQPLQVRVGNQKIGEWFRGEKVLWHFIWNFANRLTNKGAFPIEVKNSIRGIEYARHLAQVKELIYHDDIQELFRNKTPYILNKQYLDKFEL